MAMGNDSWIGMQGIFGDNKVNELKSQGCVGQWNFMAHTFPQSMRRCNQDNYKRQSK